MKVKGLNHTPVDNWWAVESSPHGGMQLTPVREMMERNQSDFLAGDDSLDYRPLWLFEHFEQAEAFRLAAVRERKRLAGMRGNG